MNGFEFASSLVDHLVWPTLVLVVLLLFRGQVAALLGRIRTYEGLGQKVSFGGQVAEAEESASQAVESIEEPTSASRGTPTEENPLVRASESNPSYAVLAAWERLRVVLADLTGAALPNFRGSHGGPAHLAALLERGVVTKEYARAVNELRELRNRVAHGGHDPAPGQAVAIVEVADDLTRVAVDLTNSMTVSEA